MKGAAVTDPFTFPCRIADSPQPWIGTEHSDIMDRDDLTVVKYRPTALVWGTYERPMPHKDYQHYALISVDLDFVYVVTDGCECCTDREDSWTAKKWGDLGWVYREIVLDNIPTQWADDAVELVLRLTEVKM
jgi:hypothetical protein